MTTPSSPSRHFRIAHLSDLHVLSLEGVSPFRFLNKRLTGYANIKFKRGQVHRPAYVRAVAKAIGEAGADHIVVTGDLTNLGLEAEYGAVRRLLECDLHLAPHDVTVVPGNHDVYTQGAARAGRFGNFFADYNKSDLPELSVRTEVGTFPVVKLRGPAAIIGMCSAIPKPPLFSSGTLGVDQLAVLERVLAHPEVRKRTPVLALHHPPHNPASKLKAYLEGLTDSPAFLDVIEGLPRGLVLFGHLHRRTHRPHKTALGEVHAISATSASLHHADEHRMAGFNLYELDEAGAVAKIGAQVFEPESGRFHPKDIPRHAWR